jgi:hypothetical protein
LQYLLAIIGGVKILTPIENNFTMKITSILTLCLLITFTASISFGQKARPRSKAAKPKTTTKAVAKGTLDLEAGLLFKSGDVKPVGRATFYLLKEDAETVLLTQEHLDIHNQEAQFKAKSLTDWSMYGAVISLSSDGITPNTTTALKKAINNVTVASETTGFDGKTTFTNIPTGNYYLFGTYRFNRSSIYWNLPISIKAGTNKIILDNNNQR